MRILVVIYLILAASGFPVPAQEDSPLIRSHPGFRERVAEREQMVKESVAGYAYYPVTDPNVLQAMRRVPRHLFVPEEYQEFAYRNSPMSIGYGQTISQPYIVAYMTQLLDLKPESRVLEIGTGSGYQAAVLAEICDQVYTIEIIAPLAKRAEQLLKELGYTQVHVRMGDGYGGWPDAAPFDGIIVTCAPEDIPPPLLEELVPGGRMVIPVGTQRGAQYLVEVRKDRKGKIKQKAIYPVRFVPMTGETEQ
jgi:protein-L-isoaspartate(D-aspartate) O-methyltransferase